jgi:hypothetical protein
MTAGSSSTGDELARRIASYVSTVVPPELVRPVTEATARAVATLMNDPFFTAELRIVADLREENQWLKSQVIQLQTLLSMSASGSGSPPRKAKPPSRKASSAKRSSTKVGGNAPRSAKAAFLRGQRQARGR